MVATIESEKMEIKAIRKIVIPVLRGIEVKIKVILRETSDRRATFSIMVGWGENWSGLFYLFRKD